MYTLKYGCILLCVWLLPVLLIAIGWLQAGKDYSFSGVFATSSKKQGANVGNGESTGVWKALHQRIWKELVSGRRIG